MKFHGTVAHIFNLPNSALCISVFACKGFIEKGDKLKTELGEFSVLDADIQTNNCLTGEEFGPDRLQGMIACDAKIDNPQSLYKTEVFVAAADIEENE